MEFPDDVQYQGSYCATIRHTVRTARLSIVSHRLRWLRAKDLVYRIPVYLGYLGRQCAPKLVGRIPSVMTVLQIVLPLMVNATL